MSLYDDLLAAGLPVISATDGVSATFSRTLTDQEDEIYWGFIFPNRAATIARQAQAENHARLIPGWATWTESEALVWGETNIGTPLANARANLPATLTLATARAAFVVVLNILDQMWIMQKAMSRMLVALRDKNFPDLPNG